jgi:tetratricopeptide (TPR) repeat protein
MAMDTKTNFSSIESLSQLLEEQEKQFGAHNPRLSATLTQLADLYFLEKDFAQAEPLYWRALGLRQASLGESHMETAESLEDLGALYEIQDRYAEAQRFYHWATRVKKAAMLKRRSDDLETTIIKTTQPKLPSVNEMEESVCNRCRRKLLDSPVCLYCTQGGFDAMAYLRAVAEKQRAAEEQAKEKEKEKRPANALRSEDGNEQYKLDEEEVGIGRHPRNRIMIADDRAVSRYHAQIKYRAGEFVLTDLDSPNGTFINGEKIAEPTRLMTGDVLTIGTKTLIAEYVS